MNTKIAALLVAFGLIVTSLAGCANPLSPAVPQISAVPARASSPSQNQEESFEDAFRHRWGNSRGAARAVAPFSACERMQQRHTELSAQCRLKHSEAAGPYCFAIGLLSPDRITTKDGVDVTRCAQYCLVGYVTCSYLVTHPAEAQAGDHESCTNIAAVMESQACEPPKEWATIPR